MNEWDEEEVEEDDDDERVYLGIEKASESAIGHRNSHFPHPSVL